MEENYFDKEGLSNSALTLFNYSPELYYKTYITKEISEKKKSEGLDYGTLIHLLIFEPEKFDEKYIISSITPVEAKMGLFLETIAGFEILDDLAYEYAHKKAEFKWSLDTIKKSIFQPKEPNGYKEYLDHLIRSKGKISITEIDNQKAVNIANNVNTLIIKDINEKYNIDITTTDDWDTYNELEIYWQENGRKYRSKLDRLYVHKSGKFYYYVDAKTDSKNPSYQYIDTFLYWKTYRQLAFYRRAIVAFIQSVYNIYPQIEKFAIAAISSVNNDIIIYPVDPSFIAKGELEIRKDIEYLDWHEENNKWKYPKLTYDQIELNGGLKLVDLEFYK